MLFIIYHGFNDFKTISFYFVTCIVCTFLGICAIFYKKMKCLEYQLACSGKGKLICIRPKALFQKSTCQGKQASTVLMWVPSCYLGLITEELNWNAMLSVDRQAVVFRDRPLMTQVQHNRMHRSHTWPCVTVSLLARTVINIHFFPILSLTFLFSILIISIWFWRTALIGNFHMFHTIVLLLRS